MCPVKSPDCMSVSELCHRWSAEWPQRSPEDLEKWLMVQCRRFPELVENPDVTRECPDFLWSAIAKIDLAPLREVCRKTRMRPPTFAPKQSKPGLEKRIEKAAEKIIAAHSGKRLARWELLAALDASGLKDERGTSITEENRAFKRVWGRLSPELKYTGRPPNANAATLPSQKAGQ